MNMMSRYDISMYMLTYFQFIVYAFNLVDIHNYVMYMYQDFSLESASLALLIHQLFCGISMRST